jgi:3-phosphoshikimate 1-carboxyvinyltransferase
MTLAQAQPTEFGASTPLRGTALVPGDKSISHRSLMFGAMARGRSRIRGLLTGEDVLATAAAMRAMGATISDGDGVWEVDGVGTGCLLQPETALDMGNSGTSTRLIMGLVASHPITATFVGDASLSKRPMRRVIDPLSRIGAEFTAAPGGRLPLTVRGICPGIPTTHRLEVASAQVKSACLLAGLNIPGITRVIEPIPTRDHSERMLRRFGAQLEVEEDGAGGRVITLRGEADLRACDVTVPRDPSSAAFPIVAALLVPGSEITLPGVLVNPLRTGLYTVLKEMGADLTFANSRDQDGEPVADLVVRHSVLRGIDVPEELVPSMIDEFPILFVAASFAQGRTRATGLEELRVKESDRIAAMAAGLRAIGGRIEEQADGVAIEGSGGEPLPGGGPIETHLDHRIAMSFAVAGLHCRAPVVVDDMRPTLTSFPGFADLLKALAE